MACDPWPIAWGCPLPAVCGCADCVAWLPDSALERLQEMGFSAKDCREALRQCEEDLNLAALWLSVHATPVSTPSSAGGQGKGGGGAQGSGSDKGGGSFSVTAVEVRHIRRNAKRERKTDHDKIVIWLWTGEEEEVRVLVTVILLVILGMTNVALEL